MEDQENKLIQKIDPIKDQLPLSYQKAKLVFDSGNNNTKNKLMLKEVAATALGTQRLNVSPRPKWISRVIQFSDVE